MAAEAAATRGRRVACLSLLCANGQFSSLICLYTCMLLASCLFHRSTMYELYDPCTTMFFFRNKVSEQLCETGANS